ncbi:unnamed protein product [Arctia plantaginis]|uniref:Strictosidine synthase conserved region domain-containing protein n=1 Tax=Arctia plantaginis TaxID=874455 RepID=A0A8S1AVM1_ARCPL|nr:unnamed protein product [Arctia plantaginis]
MGFIFNFITRIVKLFIKLSLYLAIFATLIVLIPNLPPYSKFTSIVQTPTQPRVGPLAPNDALNNVEQKYKGKLVGPEAFQVYNGELYTSLSTGEIVKISPGGHITFVTKVGLPCTGLIQEDICGRPLGFEIDDKGKTLYVADAYHGIWKVDMKTDKKQLLVSPQVEIEKRLPKLFNSVALDKNGDIYWTDSTSDFSLKDLAYSMTTDPSGRVFHYNAAKNESKVLVDDLWFPNGLVLSPNNEFLVIAETCRYKLLKHYISGPKKGQTEVFVDGLPGVPDNVRALPDGSGVLVGLFTVFDDEHPMLHRSLSTAPLARKFLARLQRLIEIPFEYLNSIYPHVIFQEIVYYIGHCKSVSPISPPLSGLVQIDWNGNIVAAYFNNDKSIGHISDGIVYNDKLYLGSPHVQDFIGSVPVPPLLKKAFETVKKSESPKVETKPQAKPKVEEKPKSKVEEVKSKEESKPKVVQKPKVEQKPKIDQKPKVEEVPKVELKASIESKPKVETKPNVEEKKKSPKDANVERAPPQQNKPTQAVKDPQQPPKTTTPSPKTTAPTAKTTGQPQATTTPKPAVKTTPPPLKPAEKSTPPPPKTTSKNPEQPKKVQTPKPSQDKVKEQIPIKEDIPSDTAKPARDTLKVIKKGGVKAEIPVPNNL